MISNAGTNPEVGQVLDVRTHSTYKCILTLYRRFIFLTYVIFIFIVSVQKRYGTKYLILTLKVHFCFQKKCFHIFTREVKAV